MKTLFAALIILASWIGVTAPAHAQTQDPRAVVQKLLDAMSAKDATTIHSIFAANAEQRYGNGAPKSGEAFKRWIESDLIKNEAIVKNAQLTATGNDVVVTGEISNNTGYRNKANFLMKVDEAGKISSWQIRY